MHKIPKEKLRPAYAEILKGASIMEIEGYDRVYAKHLTAWDTELLDIRREVYFRKATDKGLPTNKEKLKLLKENETWTPEREKEINEQKNFISRMKETKSKLILKSEIAAMDENIKQAEEKKEKITNERTQLVGLTAELFADKKVNDYYIWLALYKDPEFKEQFLSEEEFDSLTDLQLAAIVTAYNVMANKFSERNMKRMAVSGFFLNNYYLCKDNPFIFYGKPIIELTYHQIDLFSYGRYFKHILQELKHQPSQEIMEDPDLLLDQYSIQQNKEKLEKDTNKESTATASTYVGASKEDMEALGMTEDSSGEKVVNLNEEIKKAGGTLSMEDMIKLHGM